MKYLKFPTFVNNKNLQKTKDVLHLHFRCYVIVPTTPKCEENHYDCREGFNNIHKWFWMITWVFVNKMVDCLETKQFTILFFLQGPHVLLMKLFSLLWQVEGFVLQSAEHSLTFSEKFNDVLCKRELENWFVESGCSQVHPLQTKANINQTAWYWYNTHTHFCCFSCCYLFIQVWCDSVSIAIR